MLTYNNCESSISIAAIIKNKDIIITSVRICFFYLQQFLTTQYVLINCCFHFANDFFKQVAIPDFNGVLSKNNESETILVD